MRNNRFFINMTLFKIYSFSEEALNDYYYHLEPLGTKEKFWVTYENKKYLLKFSRPNTGEHWSEKIAEQICLFLKIPHASYDFVIVQDRYKLTKYGVISENIIPQDNTMILGNELLYNYDKDYPNTNAIEHIKKHTINNVYNCLIDFNVSPPSKSEYNTLTTWGYFCGYLFLDLLIGNQDRHHENWAILFNSSDKKRYLCPTYDHAASLGRELLDKNRKERLITKDYQRNIATFVKKARSELFQYEEDKQRLTTFDAFFLAAEKEKGIDQFWISKITSSLFDKFVTEIFNKIDHTLMSNDAKNFSKTMILENKKRILKRVKS